VWRCERVFCATFGRIRARVLPAWLLLGCWAALLGRATSSSVPEQSKGAPKQQRQRAGLPAEADGAPADEAREETRA